MLFSEIYSAYYNTVAAIIACAQNRELDSDSLYAIVRNSAFPESVMTIGTSLESGKWPLIKKDYTTCMKHVPTMPLSLLQKRWLKAICRDRKIRLLAGEDVLEKLEAQLHDVEPLFTENDYYLYDNYSDGDPYDDPDYIRNFKTVLEAVHRRKTIKVSYSSRFGRRKYFYCKVRKIEYSQKDDKFRIFSKVKNRHTILNLARINACELVDANDDKKLQNTGSHELEFGGKRTKASVTLEIYDDRKAMERVMLAFAHFEKSAVQVDETTYRLTLTYDSFDETELVVRTLSFGPMVKVLEPTGFRDLIKARIARQMELMEANRKHTRT